MLIPTDQHLKYQQNLGHRKIGIIVLKTTSWPRIHNSVLQVTAAVQSLPPSGYLEMEFN